jgi:hypothetical protein
MFFTKGRYNWTLHLNKVRISFTFHLQVRWTVGVVAPEVPLPMVNDVKVSHVGIWVDQNCGLRAATADTDVRKLFRALCEPMRWRDKEKAGN